MTVLFLECTKPPQSPLENRANFIPIADYAICPALDESGRYVFVCDLSQLCDKLSGTTGDMRSAVEEDCATMQIEFGDGCETTFDIIARKLPSRSTGFFSRWGEPVGALVLPEVATDLVSSMLLEKKYRYRLERHNKYGSEENCQDLDAFEHWLLLPAKNKETESPTASRGPSCSTAVESRRPKEDASSEWEKEGVQMRGLQRANKLSVQVKRTRGERESVVRLCQRCTKRRRVCSEAAVQRENNVPSTCRLYTHVKLGNYKLSNVHRVVRDAYLRYPQGVW